MLQRKFIAGICSGKINLKMTGTALLNLHGLPAKKVLEDWQLAQQRKHPQDTKKKLYS